MRDKVSGQWWEVKRNDPADLRHTGHTYSWYSTDPAINGGIPGKRGGNTCKGLEAFGGCNTQNYVVAVNAAGLCGKRDWRLPTVDELAHLSRSG